MTLSGRTIARLAARFEGGGGLSHGVIDNVWLGEDASAYLPTEGIKADRVRGGLKALRDGRTAGPDGPALGAAPDRLARVAEELSERLLAAGYISEADLPEIFDAAPSPTPSYTSQRAPATSASDPSSSREEQIPPAPAPIFIVHGHDDALLYQADRALNQATSRDVVILHEQANAGRTVIEKFEHHASAAAFAVVLLTPDDVGGARGAETQARARQNVIFELGFCFGRLGRERVAVLLAPGVEQPSDIAGLVYIKADPGGAWKFTLARELEAAGIPFDLGKIR